MTGHLVSIARRSAKRAPMEELRSVAISPEAGVAGDFRGKPGRRQVTILFEKDWKTAIANLDPQTPWTVRRANLLVTGLANPKAPGGVLAIGVARFLITGETDPCFRMDEQLDGLQATLKPDWRGGLTARVLTGGEIKVGDKAEWLEIPAT
jgi:MOSC domain-containing protein YiiM